MLVTSGVVIRKFYIEQMHVFVRMQFHNHVETQPVKRFGRGGRGGLEILAKRDCFLSFEWEKTNFTTLGPLDKFWKIPLVPPPGKNPSAAFDAMYIRYQIRLMRCIYYIRYQIRDVASAQ